MVAVDCARVVRVKRSAEEPPTLVRWRTALAERPSMAL